MDFNTLNFLFIFFPIFLILFLIFKPKYRKWLLLLGSLLFYFVLQKDNFVFILCLLSVNYLVIFFINKYDQKIRFRKGLFWFGIIANLLVLIIIKAITSSNWFDADLFSKFRSITFIKDLSYPVGLSFITFQIISCLIDTNRSKDDAPKNPLDYFLYLLFFPKIVLGPITRFNLFEPQIDESKFSWDRFSTGLKRFIRGLAKKAIIADQLAIVVNAGFGLDIPAFSTHIAWVLLIAFFIQIYYDFSGYIDMALGIAHIFGFDLPENFNYPYLSKSVTEFWRKWHITLTAWFREYVFYPLEFKRRKVKRFRIETHTVLIFLLTGLWHGLTINYVIWGLLQGIILIFENSRFGKWLRKLPGFLQRIYLIGMVMFSWVIFRSPSIEYSLFFFKRLIVYEDNFYVYPFSMTQPLPIINNSVYAIILIGIIGILPLSKLLSKPWLKSFHQTIVGKILVDAGYILLLLIAIAFIVSQNFVPSIYGRF